MSDQITFRKAASGDIPVLVAHRHRMFEDMAAPGGQHLQLARLEEMDKAYADYLEIHLAGGTVRAWVADLGGQVVGSGAISILAWPPGPGRAGERTALLHSMYTDAEYRKRGIARHIMETVVEFCQENGCKRIILGGRGSEAGQVLYESVGFKPIELSQLIL